MPTIFFTTECVAGTSIAKQLASELDFVEQPEVRAEGLAFKNWRSGGIQLVQLETRLSTDAEYVSRFFQGDLLVFASRHRSEAGVPALTVHATGNWGSEAALGGKPGELGLTSAKAIKSAFDFLCENKPGGFDVSLEATHHGPTSLSSPSIFVELGSSPREWGMAEPARIVAQAILHCARNYGKETGAVALGFGGTHYCSTFNKVARESDFLLSHVAPKHALAGVDAEIIGQAVRKTSEKVELALIDWKGCTGGQRSNVIMALEELGLEYERV